MNEEYLLILMIFMFVIPAVRSYGIKRLASQWQVNILTQARLLALLGGCSNIFVSAMNFGMPVRGLGKAHGIWVPMTDKTILPMLGDIIRTPIGMVSVGDIMLGFAAILLIVCLPSIVLVTIKHGGGIKAGQYSVRF